MYFVLELEALLFPSPQWDDFCLKGTFILTVTILFKNANISFYWVTTDWGRCREAKVTVGGWSGKASWRRWGLVGLGRDDSFTKWKSGRREGNKARDRQACDKHAWGHWRQSTWLEPQVCGCAVGGKVGKGKWNTDRMAPSPGKRGHSLRLDLCRSKWVIDGECLVLRWHRAQVQWMFR